MNTFATEKTSGDELETISKEICYRNDFYVTGNLLIITRDLLSNHVLEKIQISS